MTKFYKNINFEDLEQSAYILVVQIVVVLIGFLNSSILAKILDHKEYGTYQYLIMWLAICASLGMSGMSSPILKASVKNIDQFYFKATEVSSRASYLLSILGLSIGLILRYYNASWVELANIIILISLSIPAAGKQNYDSFLIGKRCFRQSRVIQLIGAVIIFVSTSLAGYFGGNAVYTYLAFVTSTYIIVLLGHSQASKLIPNDQSSYYDTKELLAQGIRQTFIVVVFQILSRTDRIVIGALSPEIFAQYYVGAIIPNNIKNNMKFFLSVTGTRWGKLDAQNNSKLLKDSTFILFIVGVFVAALTAFIVYITVPFFFGNNYGYSVLVGLIFCLTLIPAPYAYLRGLEDQLQSQGIWSQISLLLRYIIQSILVFFVVNKGIYWIAGAVVLSDYIYCLLMYVRPNK